MNPAGRERYRQRREEAAHSDQAITASPKFAPHMGVAGFYPPDDDTPNDSIPCTLSESTWSLLHVSRNWQ